MTSDPASWLMLVTSLIGRSPTPRMRLWRALKAAGAAALRDGVYVLPADEAGRRLFRTQADEVLRAGGTAQLVPFTAASPEQEAELRAAFDRTPVYAEGLERLALLLGELPSLAEIEGRRRLAALRRDLDAIVATDFFPGAAREQVEVALSDAERALNAQFQPDEPHAAHGAILRRDAASYRGRIWATRRHLWIDRVASAWLIRRFEQFGWATKVRWPSVGARLEPGA